MTRYRFFFVYTGHFVVDDIRIYVDNYKLRILLAEQSNSFEIFVCTKNRRVGKGMLY